MSALRNMPPPFTVRSLAERWGCSEGAIRKRIADGDLRSFRIGVLIRIAANEVERVEQCQNMPSNDLGEDGQSSGTPPMESDTASSLPRLTSPVRKLRLASGGASPKEARAPWEA